MSLAHRYYPPITAATYRLNRFLYELKSDRMLQRRFFEERERCLAESDLAPEEREAIARVDLPRLVSLGAHPFLARGLYTMVDRHDHPEGYIYY